TGFPTIWRPGGAGPCPQAGGPTGPRRQESPSMNSRTMPWQAGAGASALACVAVWLSHAALSGSGGAPEPGAPYGEPPRDAAYQQALRQGLRGDLAGGEAVMLEIARSRAGTNEGAWALYQAGIAERARHHPARAAALFARLRREYP